MELGRLDCWMLDYRLVENPGKLEGKIIRCLSGVEGTPLIYRLVENPGELEGTIVRLCLVQ